MPADVNRVAGELSIFLAPIVNTQAQFQAEQELRAQPWELCKDALKLVIMVRKCPEECRCEAISVVEKRPMAADER